MERPIQVLVCDGDPMHDWPAIFRDHDLVPALAGRFRVVQASWMEISVVVYGGDPACTVVTAAPVHETGGVVRPATVTFEPDICVIRNQPRGPTPSSDRRAVLFGLMSGNVPALNSLESEYMQLERPLMCGGLRSIEQRLGHEQFPFIHQNYYTNSTAMVISPTLPAIIKVSHAHRGMGKIRVDTQTQFRDVATVLALHNEYCTGESFVEAEYGIRIQKIGTHYRVLKKTPTGGSWKSQFGGCDLTETVCVPLSSIHAPSHMCCFLVITQRTTLQALTPEYKRWIDECAKLFGGLDWCALDAMHGIDGKDYIIELNGSAIGFKPQHWLEDTLHIRELVLDKLAALGFIAPQQ